MQSQQLSYQTSLNALGLECECFQSNITEFLAFIIKTNKI